MNRLTKKVSKIEAMLDYGSEYTPSENCHSEFELYYKLGKLEDIEQDLGCPLEVVFKALKDGQVITKHIVGPENPKVILLPHKIAEILFNVKNYSLWAYENGCDDGFYLNTKDYGKTWALTREELEENETSI